NEDDDAEDEDEDLYLGALFNIETSPGFKVLESLRAKDEAPESRIQALRERFRGMHNFLLKHAEYEKALGKRVKHLQQEVANQRMEIDRTGSKQFSDNSLIGELKREALKAQNEVNLAKDRQTQFQREIEEAQRLKGELTADIDEIRKHKGDMLEPQLLAASKDVRMELQQKKLQVETLTQDLEEKLIDHDRSAVERNRLETERERHSTVLNQASEMPQKILKQIGILSDAISSLTVENVKQGALGQHLEKELERLEKKRRTLEEFKLDHAAEYEQQRAEINEMERQCDDIYKDLEIAKEGLASRKAERVRLDLEIRRTIMAIKREHDILLRTIREKESLLKHSHRLETTVNNIRMSTPAILKQRADLERELELAGRDEKHFRKEVTELRKAIDLLLYEFLKQEQAETRDGERLTAQLSVNRKMEEELAGAIEACAGAGRAVESLSTERNLKAREVVRIRNKYRSIKLDLSVKEMAIFDASKRCSESVTRLREFATLYDVVKNERNKYLNQIQATLQRAAEMKEKIKILSNEIEILRHEIMNKDRELARRRQQNTAAYALRDGAKNEANKLLAQYRERRDEIEQHLSRIETYNMLIAAAEADLQTLKDRHEAAARTRNSVGVQLLDRNDELCILYERLNVQDSTLRAGEVALAEREDELRKLGLVVAELARHVELGKREAPHAVEEEKKLLALEEELEQARKEVARLSGVMESPDGEGRCRDLGGEDPGQKELLGKIKLLEETLAEKEEKILEKDLVLEEVSTLTNRLKRQTLEGRQETGEVAARINELGKKLKHVTKAMMARVSELSMHQALAMSLYQEKCEKQTLLAEARARLEAGEVPTEAIERDFIRAERARLKHDKERQDLRERRDRENAGGYVEIDDSFYIYNNIRTTAEPRPNAYIPNASGVGELPIPKPYGAHAPFKPQDQGSQIRHYRKPANKPVEI
ncbi:hypothetical protein BDK51DRAFT_24341, partial [Blyttiomyces helicus]